MKFSWHLDNFDSGVFGFKVAKITEIDSVSSIKDLIKDLIKNKIEYATSRVESGRYEIMQGLQNANFLLIDAVISLGLNTPQIDKRDSHIREATVGDLKSLKKLTKGLFLSSRIYNDPSIPENKADKFYEKWVENSVLVKIADSVLVWDEGGEILGYVTLKKKGQIPLLGVSSKARGKGIARKLLESSFNKFRKWGVEKVAIETQINNIAALRVYQDCGFKVVNSYFTLRWKND